MKWKRASGILLHNYCNERFGDGWHFSPEQSLLLHAEKTVIPTQFIIHRPKATNHKIPLLFGTSHYDLKIPQMPPPAVLAVRDGLHLVTTAAALIRVPEAFLAANVIEARVVLGSLRDASELLRRLLDSGHTVVAGRLSKS